MSNQDWINIMNKAPEEKQTGDKDKRKKIFG